MDPLSWQAKAREQFPELNAEILEFANSGLFWCDLISEFELAYVEPRNEDLISRIYEYASWCFENGERSDTADLDVPSHVAGFYEFIPSRQASRDDMPRWFSRESIIDMRDIFSYIIGEDGFKDLLRMYDIDNITRKDQREARKPVRAWRRK